MATLNGIVRFSGKVGDLIFYRRGKKDVARSKPDKHELSEKSKKSGRDFGEASRNAAYIRKAFAALVKSYGTGDITSRLTKRMNAVFKSIPASQVGQKKIYDGNLKLMEGFEFNVNARLDRFLLQPVQIKVTAEKLMEVELPKTTIKQFVKTIPRAEAFRLQLMVFNFDLNGGDFEIFTVTDLDVPLELTDFPGALLTIPIETAGTRGVLLALGISYLQDRSRKEDKRYFACQIMYSMQLKDGVEVEFIAPEVEKAVQVEDQHNVLSWVMRG